MLACNRLCLIWDLVYQPFGLVCRNHDHCWVAHDALARSPPSIWTMLTTHQEIHECLAEVRKGAGIHVH